MSQDFEKNPVLLQVPDSVGHLEKKGRQTFLK